MVLPLSASVAIPLLLGDAHVSPPSCAFPLQDRFLDLDAPDGVAGWLEPDWLD